MRNYGKIVLLVLAALLVLGAAITTFQPAPPPAVRPLLPVARQVAAIPAETRYWWLSETTLLLLPAPAQPGAAFQRRNLTDGRETPLPALTALFRETKGRPETLRVAPNGRWLLWSGAEQTTILATPDGQEHHRITTDAPTYNVWRFDSQGWFELHGTPDAYTMAGRRSLKDPQEGLPIALYPPIPRDANKVNLERITATHDNRLLVHYWNAGRGDLAPTRIMVTGFGANPLLADRLNFTPPRMEARGDVVFSTNTGQFVWILDFQQPPPGFLNRLLNRQQSYTGFWINTLGGRKARELGSLVTTDGEQPTQIQFSPEGKQISFLYRNALWVIPVE